MPLAMRELPEEDGLTLGYLMPAPAEGDWSAEHIPEEWRDERQAADKLARAGARSGMGARR